MNFPKKKLLGKARTQSHEKREFHVDSRQSKFTFCQERFALCFVNIFRKQIFQFVRTFVLWINRRDETNRFVSHRSINSLARRDENLPLVRVGEGIFAQRHGASPDTALDLSGSGGESRQHQQDCRAAEPHRKLRNFPSECASFMVSRMCPLKMYLVDQQQRVVRKR